MQKYQHLRQLVILIIGLFAIVLLVGTLGFYYIGELSLIDSFYNSAMFLSGLGPVFEMKTTSQKLFATFYALFAAVIFLAVIIYTITKILQIEKI
jgi:hypothetical protein